MIKEKYKKANRLERIQEKEKGGIPRPSPIESATLFPVGHQKIGNDGNWWEVKADKRGVQSWKRIENPPEEETITPDINLVEKHSALIKKGFINEDLSLTNKGKRIVELHKFCFPLKSHPFSHIYSTPSDIYDTFQYVNIDGTIMFTGGDNKIFEIGTNFDQLTKDNATHNKDLEIKIKITKQDNTQYKPYSYCPGITEDKSGVGFIVFCNYINSNELYIKSELYNYAINHYEITDWRSDSKNAVLLYGYNGNDLKVVIRVEEQVVGLFDMFGLFDKDATLNKIREKYPELYYVGESVADFQSKSEPKINEEKRQAAIKGIELMIEIAETDEERQKYQKELEKLKT